MFERNPQATEFAVTVLWQGGRVDELSFPKTVNVPQPRRTDESTVDLVGNLSAHYSDRTVARVLNRQGRRTARGLPFTRDLVCELRRSRGIPAHADREGQDDGAALGVADAARDLGVNEATLYRWIRAGLVPVIDPGVDGAPFRVRMTEELRARFRPQAPEIFVPVRDAAQRLGVSRRRSGTASGPATSLHATSRTAADAASTWRSRKGTRFRCSGHHPEGSGHERERRPRRFGTAVPSIVQGRAVASGLSRTM